MSSEQPFTRSLSGVAIPDDVAEVTIRAHDRVHGFGDPELKTPYRDHRLLDPEQKSASARVARSSELRTGG